MLYACVQRFDVTDDRENILGSERALDCHICVPCPELNKVKHRDKGVQLHLSP
jgi:hypothetical protein